MDTRFWGPSGWKLLHLISFDYTFSPENAITYARFLETIPYILPCKFCRASLTDYYRQHPYHTGGFTINGRDDMNPTLDMKRWMYTIHNCVNSKLKKQGLHKTRNPSFASVSIMYADLLKCPWNKQLALCWDFLFAVAYHHPKEKNLYAKPMPYCPKEVYTCNDACEKNKWNLLPLKERMEWFKRFWSYLPAVLPSEMAQKWKAMEEKHPPTLSSRHSALAWLWRMRCGLDADFADPYTSVCKKIAKYSSDCGTSNRSVTCRRLLRNKTLRNKTLRNKTLRKTKKKQNK